MGLAYDIAAATLRPSVGGERKDPKCGWHFLLSYGIEVDGGVDGDAKTYGSEDFDDKV